MYKIIGREICVSVEVYGILQIERNDAQDEELARRKQCAFKKGRNCSV